MFSRAVVFFLAFFSLFVASQVYAGVSQYFPPVSYILGVEIRLAIRSPGPRHHRPPARQHRVRPRATRPLRGPLDPPGHPHHPRWTGD